MIGRAEIQSDNTPRDLPPAEDLAMGHLKVIEFGGEVDLIACAIEVGDCHETGGMPGVILRLRHPEGGRFVLLTAEGTAVLIASLQRCLAKVEATANADLAVRLTGLMNKGDS